jgi:hypothetical protein
MLANDKVELQRQCELVGQQRAEQENRKIAELEQKLAQHTKHSDIPFSQQT